MGKDGRGEKCGAQRGGGRGVRGEVIRGEEQKEKTAFFYACMYTHI